MKDVTLPLYKPLEQSQYKCCTPLLLVQGWNTAQKGCEVTRNSGTATTERLNKGDVTEIYKITNGMKKHLPFFHGIMWKT